MDVADGSPRDAHFGARCPEGEYNAVAIFLRDPSLHDDRVGRVADFCGDFEERVARETSESVQRSSSPWQVVPLRERCFTENTRNFVCWQGSAGFLLGSRVY